MLLLRCKSLVNLLLKSVENLNNADYLKRSQCDGSGINVTACCPVADLRADLDRKAARLLPARAICGHQLAQRVSSGNITKPTEFPWTVQLWYSMWIVYCHWILSHLTRPLFSGYQPNKVATFCHGALINQDHVLTSSVCVTGKYIQLGIFKL